MKTSPAPWQDSQTSALGLAAQAGQGFRSMSWSPLIAPWAAIQGLTADRTYLSGPRLGEFSS